MDPITSAIVAAVAAGVSKMGEGAITDAYNGLKALIVRKFGKDSDVIDAVQRVEDRPDSDARKGVLQEEMAAAKADQDAEIRAAAEELLKQIKAQPGGEQHIQQAIGSYIAQADRGGHASVNANQPPQKNNS